MINFNYEHFKKDIISRKRTFKSGVNKLYEQAQDEEQAKRERQQIISWGWLTYVFADCGRIFEAFDEGYKLGADLYDLLSTTTKQAVAYGEPFPTDNQNADNKHLKLFQEIFPLIKMVNGRSYLYYRLKEDDSLETTYRYFVEWYALSQLKNELSSNSEKNNTETIIKKIEWNGTQKELADFCITMTNQGWFDKLPEPDTLKAVFTKSNSIEQLLKPSRDSEIGQPSFEKIYAKRYESPFSKIEINKKK